MNSLIENMETNSVVSNFKDKLHALEKAYKAGHISAWAFMNCLMIKIENFTSAVKNGWGKATYWSQKIASDISDLQSDIAAMKKGNLTDDQLKKFLHDMLNFQKDAEAFKKAFENQKYPDPSMKDLFNDLDKQIKGILGYKFSFSDTETIGDILDYYKKHYKESPTFLLDDPKLKAYLGELRHEFSFIFPGTKMFDQWLNGDSAGNYEGFTALGQENGNLSTSGQRELTKLETEVSTLNNVASSCSKSMTDMMSTMVRNQIAQ